MGYTQYVQHLGPRLLVYFRDRVQACPIDLSRQHTSIEPAHAAQADHADFHPSRHTRGPPCISHKRRIAETWRKEAWGASSYALPVPPSRPRFIRDVLCWHEL